MNKLKDRRRPASGFTLIELMIVVAMAAILALITMPGLTAYIARTRSFSTLDALQVSADMARSEAMARGHTVTLCARDGDDDEHTCSTNGEDWAKGWLILSGLPDTQRSDDRDTIRVSAPLVRMEIKVESSSPSATPGAITYNRLGVRYDVNESKEPSEDITFMACPNGQCVHSKVLHLHRARNEILKQVNDDE